MVFGPIQGKRYCAVVVTQRFAKKKFKVYMWETFYFDGQESVMSPGWDPTEAPPCIA